MVYCSKLLSMISIQQPSAFHVITFCYVFTQSICEHVKVAEDTKDTPFILTFFILFVYKKQQTDKLRSFIGTTYFACFLHIIIPYNFLFMLPRRTGCVTEQKKKREFKWNVLEDCNST